MDLYFKEYNKEKEKTIIFLHGTFLAGWMWDNQLEYFNDFHILVPDLPGHGYSVCEDDNFSISACVISVIELINKYSNSEKVFLVGVSLGSQVILEILSVNPGIIDQVFISGLYLNNSKNDLFVDNILGDYGLSRDDDFFIKAYLKYYGLSKDYFNMLKWSFDCLSDSVWFSVYCEFLGYVFNKKLDGFNDSLIVVGSKESMGVIRSSYFLSNEYSFDLLFISDILELWNILDYKKYNDLLSNWLNNKKKDMIDTN